MVSIKILNKWFTKERVGIQIQVELLNNVFTEVFDYSIDEFSYDRFVNDVRDYITKLVTKAKDYVRIKDFEI